MRETEASGLETLEIKAWMSVLSPWSAPPEHWSYKELNSKGDVLCYSTADFV